jgi:hypothetical protein
MMRVSKRKDRNLHYAHDDHKVQHERHIHIENPSQQVEIINDPHIINRISTSAHLDLKSVNSTNHKID